MERQQFRHTPELPRTQTFVDAGKSAAPLVPVIPAQAVTIETPAGAAPEDVFGRMAVRTVEHTSPMAQAQAFLVKYAGLTAVLAVLSVGLVWWLRAPAPMAVVTFGGLAIAGYWLLAWTDAMFTVTGAERHRLTQGAKVLRAQIQAERDVRMAQVRLQQSIVEAQRDYNRQLAERHRQRLREAAQPSTAQPMAQQLTDVTTATEDAIDATYTGEAAPTAGTTAQHILLDFTASLYERGEDGRLLRVDVLGYVQRDTVIPFGKRGGLTQAQRQQVAGLLVDIERHGGWLLKFDKDKRQWRLNMARYADADAAIDAIENAVSHR